MFARNIADWCNGSTADSDSVSRGSSPLSVVPWQGRRIPLDNREKRYLDFIGVWLSLVERYVRDVEVACSNHVTPTDEKTTKLIKALWFFHALTHSIGDGEFSKIPRPQFIRFGY